MTILQKSTIALCVLSFSALQTGCGLKGNLYLPDAVQAEKIKASEEINKQKQDEQKKQDAK